VESENLYSLFKNLLYVRLVEEKIVELYPEQEMRCPVHLSIGQEAIGVGVSQALTKNDLIFSNHRAHGHYLAKGGDLKKFFAEIYGKITGCSKGRGGSMHLVDLNVGFVGSTPLVGNIIPVALGAAFTSSFNNQGKIIVVFLGDAASEEGVLHESLNFAKLKNLPIIFFCENNLYSVYTSLNKRQPDRKIIDIAKAHGLTSFEVDGNDALAVYKRTKEAIESIKFGNGPVFIESPTYRWREHCGPNYDNNIGYRTEEEFLKWKERCPLEKLQLNLIQLGILTEQEILSLREKISFKINEAVIFAKMSPYPSKEDLIKYIYA